MVPARRAPALRALPNVTVYSGIPDEGLRSLYQRATLFFLPLTGGSANNAVMQALACGTPIVATDLPALKSYIPPEAGRFAAQGNAQAHRAAILRLIGDPDAVGAASAVARARGQAGVP